MSNADRFIATAGVLLAAAAASALELVDPMQPPPSAVAAPSVDATVVTPGAWRLGAIRIETGRRSAMINGQMVTVGDAVDGARVLAIAPRSVDIAVGNAITTLSLLQHDIKIRPSSAR